MKNFNSLINLINKLGEEEVKSLNKFLKYYNEKNNNNKSSRLLEIILNSKEYNLINIQKQLYDKVNWQAYNKLIDRLKDKILEVLLFNSNISREEYPERIRVIFELKKKLILCDVLSFKGLRDDADLLCRKIIAKADKYELYDIVMNSLIIRQRFVNIRKKEKEVNNIQKGIQIAELKYKSLLNSQIVYNKILNIISNSPDSIIFINDLKSSIDQIELELKINNSDTVSYYLYFLKTELYQIEEKFEEASISLLKIENLLSKKSVYSENRKGTTLLNISNNNIYLKKYKESIQFAEKAKKYFPNNVYNQALVDENLFYANFYLNNLDISARIIKGLVNLPSANNILFSISKWNYFEAVIDFLNNKFQVSIFKLNNIVEMDKDKEGWNINKRLLIIMSRIELKEYESADLQVNSLEKFIKRSLQKRDISLRYIFILRILIKLINSNYNFKIVYENRKKYFQLIASDDINLKWRIKSPELIKFDNWFLSKCNS